MKTKDLLRSLGLSTYEADVYEALVRLGRAKVQDIARVTPVPRPQIYVALGRLMDKGLCGEERGKVSHYTVVPPDAAFKSLLQREHDSLEMKVEGVKRLADLHRQADKETAPADFIRVLKGGQIKEFMDDLAANAEREVVTFFKSAQEKDAQSLEGAVALEAGIIKRGVRVRCVYEERCLDNPGIPPILKRLLAFGEQARVVPSVPMNMLVVDDKASLFSLTTDKGDITVFAFTHPALVVSMRQNFQYLWDKGRGLKEVMKQRKL